MLPTEDLFVHLYVLVDDAVTGGVVVIPPRPGPVPACSDAEVLTVALARHLLGRRSEAGWLAEVKRDWAHLFPRLPHQSEFNRRARWCWGAFEQLRARLAARVPEDPWQQVDTSALPVRHPSRVRGPDGWTGPAHLAAGFGRDAAHAEWFYGFRLALRTDLGSRLVRGWGIVPAAVNEREVADDLLDGARPPAGLLLDRRFTGRAFAADQAARGTRVVCPQPRGTPPRSPPAAPPGRRAAQPDRDQPRRGHRPPGTRPSRGAYLLGAADRAAATPAAHTLLQPHLL